MSNPSHLGAPLSTPNKGGVIGRRGWTEDEKRQHHRNRALGHARAGKDLRSRYDIEDLVWMFPGDELAEVEAQAAAVRATKHEREANSHHRRELGYAIDAVVAERERQQRAADEATARKRMGWPATGWPDD